MKRLALAVFVLIAFTGAQCILFGQTKFEILYDKYKIKYEKVGSYFSDTAAEALPEYKELYSSLAYAPEIAKYLPQDARLHTAFLKVTGMRKEIQYRKTKGFNSELHFVGLWKLGQKGLDKRLNDYLQQLDKNKSEEAIILENINCMGFAVLPECFIRIKAGDRRLILPILQLISDSSFYYLPAPQEDPKLSFEKALVACKTNFSKHDFRIVSSESCWRWWKANWQDWVIPFPDQNADAIEAKIIAVDSTYIPLSQRTISDTKQN